MTCLGISCSSIHVNRLPTSSCAGVAVLVCNQSNDILITNVTTIPGHTSYNVVIRGNKLRLKVELKVKYLFTLLLE
jgi:hypothetical protein